MVANTDLVASESCEQGDNTTSSHSVEAIGTEGSTHAYTGDSTRMGSPGLMMAFAACHLDY